MRPKGHKVVIYFYEDHGHVVDTIATEKGYKETNERKAHLTTDKGLVEAIKKV